MVLVDLSTVVFHPDLFLCPAKMERKMQMILDREGVTALEYSHVNTPFIIKDKQQLLSHHLVYLIAKHSGMRSIYMRPIMAGDQVAEILAIDKLTCRLLELAILSKGTFTAQTRSHQKRRAAQQICPLCQGVLTGQKSKDGRIQDGKEVFKIKCHYRHYKDYKCNFEFDLDKAEYILFKRGRFPTSRWLLKLGKEHCPKCNADLFERKSSDGKIFHQCLETLISQDMDEDYCNYCEEIINDKL